VEPKYLSIYPWPEGATWILAQREDRTFVYLDRQGNEVWVQTP